MAKSKKGGTPPGLTENKCKRAGPGKHADGGGLTLLVKPSGRRLWRLRYRWAGRETALGFGAYPDVSLKEARAERDKARAALANGKNPSAERRAARRTQRADAAEGERTFRAVAAEWLERHAKSVEPGTYARDKRELAALYPSIGNRPVGEVEPRDMLAALRKLATSGSADKAMRARQLAHRVYKYAVVCGDAALNPAADLEEALPRHETTNRPAIVDRKRLGGLLRTINAYDGQPATRAALQLMVLCFPRPGELRQALWCEFDLENALWTVPAERMKMRRPHLAPLAAQARRILEELATITDHGPDSLVFPGLRPGRPLSENTLNMALRNLGFDTKREHCAHGFRSTASTLLHELGWDSDAIECQLAHARPGVGGIYNRSHRLEERRRMMQAWADFLDTVRADKDSDKVVPIGKKRA